MFTFVPVVGGGWRESWTLVTTIMRRSACTMKLAKRCVILQCGTGCLSTTCNFACRVLNLMKAV